MRKIDPREIPRFVIETHQQNVHNVEAVKQKLRQQYSSNPEVQRRQGMSNEARQREIKDTMTQKYKTLNDARYGSKSTHEMAERKVAQLMEKMNRGK